MATRTLRLYVTADGRQAVRAFEEVGAASKASADEVEGSAVKQQAALDEVGKSGKRLTSGIGMLAGTIGFGGLAIGIKDAINAAQTWQVQQSQLQLALKNTGIYSKQLLDSFEKTAEFQSVHGGFSGPQELQAITQFVRLTHNATKATQLNDAAMNLARGTNLGYTQAQRMIGQVLTGNVGRLQRYLGIIQPVKTAEYALSQAHKFNVAQMEAQAKAMGPLGSNWLHIQEIIHGLTPQMVQHAQLIDKQSTAMEVMQRIQQRYGGATQAFSRTTAGAISNLRNQFDILMKTIGTKLLPVINQLLQFISKHTTAVLILAGVLTGLAVTYGVVTAATVAWGAATTIAEGVAATAAAATGVFNTAVAALGVAFVEMGVSASVAWVLATGGIILVVAAVAAAIYWVVTHFKQFKAALGDIWKGIKSGFHWLVDAFKDAFNAIVNLPVVKQVLGIIDTVANFIGGGSSHHNYARATNIGRFGVVSPGRASHITLQHHAEGGLLGGYGASDDVPFFGTPGEYVLRREAVQNIGVQRLNAINSSGSLAGAGGASDTLHVTMPVQLRMPGGRILAEEIVQFAARKNALSGSYVSG